MSDDKQTEHEQHEDEELDGNAELLPDREVMSMVRAPVDPTLPMDPPGGGGEVTLPVEPPATE
jgi:hypothetical protein